MLRIYNYMATGLAISGLVALAIAYTAVGDIFFQTVQGYTQQGQFVSARQPTIFGWIGIFAPLGILLIAMFAGIWSFAALLAIFGVNSAMILFGVLMERHQTPGNPDWSAFTFGTLAGLQGLAGQVFVMRRHAAGGRIVHMR